MTGHPSQTIRELSTEMLLTRTEAMTPLQFITRSFVSFLITPNPTLMAFTGVTNAHGPSSQPIACSGQSYKASTITIYYSRVVSISNLLVITTLES